MTGNGGIIAWVCWLDHGILGVPVEKTQALSVECSKDTFPGDHFRDFLHLYTMWLKMTDDERIQKSRDPDGYIMATMDLS